MLVVTGSTGHVGRLVAGELSTRGMRQRLLVRDPLRAPDIAGAEIAMADYGDPQSIADDIPGWFDADGLNTVPAGEGRMSFSYRPELARAIAVTLTEPGHEGKAYDIVTPQSVSMRELAEIAWAVTGQNYRYAPTSDAWWEERWRARGKEPWEIEAGLTSYAALRAGEFDVASDDYRTLTGEDPLSVSDIAGLLADRLPLHA